MDPVVTVGSRRGWRRFAPGTIRGTLFLLLLVAILPVLILQGVLHYNRFQEARAQELEANLEVARAVGSTFDAYTDHVLSQELALGVAFTTPQPPDAAQMTRLLKESLRGYPSLRYYVWVAPTGRVIASSSADALGIDLSDRPYFREIVHGRDWVVGNLIVGRVTGEPTFAIARGARDESGALLGVVAATADPGGLADVLGVQRAGRSDIAILDGQGLLVYRYPEVELTWEQRLPVADSSSVHDALRGKEVGTTSISAVDGRETMMALVPIRSIGWAAMASHPVDEAMAPIIEDLAKDFLLLLLVAAFSVVVALFIARYLTVPMGRLRDYALAVGRGQATRPVVVSGPAEVDALGKAFNRMAREISLRETQREQLLHRQRESLEMQEDLLRAISHDLRTPLTSILGYAQYIEYALEKVGRLGDAKRSAHLVAASARQMNSMIQDLVDGGRVESGQLTLNLSTVRIDELVEDLKEHLAGAIEVGRIEVSLPTDLPPVLADPLRLERILTNIATNALKYSPSSSSVVVGAKLGDEYVTVFVRDQGTGIAPEDIPHLFDRFYRAVGARKTEGLGLGLYVTRSLVEAHGGRIWVESEIGTGTTFYFTIPVARPDAEPPPRPSFPPDEDPSTASPTGR